MEEEARAMLRAALSPETATSGNLAQSIQARFAPFGGVDLEPLPREPMQPPLSV